MEPRSNMVDCTDDSTPSDAVLVHAAQAGDPDAVELLLERHYPWLVRVLAHRVRDVELANDVAQEAMFAAVHQLDTLRDGASFKPWLYRIALNQLHSAHRRLRRRPSVSLDELTARFPWRRELAVADTHIDRYGEREAVRHTLAQLSDSDRELLLLRFVAGFSGAQVAQIIGISPEAARQRTARAIQRYQQQHGLAQPRARLSFEKELLA